MASFKLLQFRPAEANPPVRSAGRSRRLSRRFASDIRRKAVFTTRIAVPCRPLLEAARRTRPRWRHERQGGKLQTLKAEAVSLRDYETFEDVTAGLPASSMGPTNHRRHHAAPGYPRAARREAGRDQQKSRTAMLRGPSNGCILPRHLAATLEQIFSLRTCSNSIKSGRFLPGRIIPSGWKCTRGWRPSVAI